MAKQIREFDLDAPALPREARSNFRYQTRSLTSLFEQCVAGKIALGKGWKVLVEVVPEITYARHRNLLGVLVVQIAHDPVEFFELDSDREKCEYALNLLVEGASKLAKELNADGGVFAAAAEMVRALGFRNVREWIKPCANPDGTLKADVVVDHRVSEARIVGRILDANNEVVSESVLAIERPDEFVFASVLGTLAWLDSRTIELKSKDGQCTWRFSANSAS